MKRPPLDQTLISVVLPVYNEAHVLAELLHRVDRALRNTGVRQEIIFVNDGSTDASPRVLDQLAERNSQVRVIHFSRNFGHQAAVQAGLEHARGDAVVLMDSDLQDEPEAIARFLVEWQAGYDVVYAIRSQRQEPWWKRFLFAAFHRTLAAIASVRIPPDAGNFGLIDARLVRQIVDLGERDRYLPGLRSWVGFQQKGVAVRRNPRYDDKPRVSLWGLWRLAKTAIFSFSSFPLTIFYLIGYSSLALFAALSGFSIFCRLFTTLAVPGWTSQVLAASFFGAVNSLGISMLGEYVIRIYDQVRGRPMYIVDRTVSGVPASTATSTAATDGQKPTVRATDLTSEEMVARQTGELLAMVAQATSGEPARRRSDVASAGAASDSAGVNDAAATNSPAKVARGRRKAGGRKAK
jgi:dolichol-phosphate mannosyltransferase